VTLRNVDQDSIPALGSYPRWSTSGSSVQSSTYSRGD